MNGTDDTPTEGRTGPDLRTITVRLTDLQRKCRSVGLRTDEAVEMEERLAAVLAALDAAGGAGDEPVPFADLARRLFPVERFFESNGFLSVSREVAHVERALEALAEPGEEIRPASRPEPDPSQEAAAATTDAGDEEPAATPASRWAMPRPVATVLALFVLAVAVCVGIILHEGAGPEAVPDLPDPTPAMIAAPSPTPRPAPQPRRDPSTQSPGARLAEEIGKARLALEEGDVDRAMDHISLAALVDSDDATVLSAAERVVALLVDRSDAAAHNGDWDGADECLDRARGVATRFGLDQGPIEDAVFRHGQMARFRLVRPNDEAAIRAAAGRRVTVHLLDGSRRESVIKGVSDGALLLEEDTTVRGGTVTYTDRIPLATIDRLQIWEH